MYDSGAYDELVDGLERIKYFSRNMKMTFQLSHNRTCQVCKYNIADQPQFNKYIITIKKDNDKISEFIGHDAEILNFIKNQMGLKIEVDVSKKKKYKKYVLKKT